MRCQMLTVQCDTRPLLPVLVLAMIVACCVNGDGARARHVDVICIVPAHRQYDRWGICVLRARALCARTPPVMRHARVTREYLM